MLHSISSRFTTVRGFWLSLLVAAFFANARVNGQDRPASQLPRITYTKHTIFHLPVQLDEKTRPNQKEIRLYVKVGNGEWVRFETAPATQPYFRFKAPHDGEYWFSLGTMDNAGNVRPDDVTKEPPDLRVVVDTVAPELEIKISTNGEGERCLSCHVRDTNPDLESVKATYRDDTGEHELEAVRSNPVIFKIAGLQIPDQKIKITAADLSRNYVSRDINLAELLASYQQVDSNSSQPTDQDRQTDFAPLPTSPAPKNGILRRLVHRLAVR